MSPSIPRCYRRHQGTAVLLRLLLCSIITGLCGSQEEIHQTVNAVLGKDVTLECKLEVKNITVFHKVWRHILPTGHSKRVARYRMTPDHTYTYGRFSNRVYFRSPSSHDATLVLKDVVFDDVGTYTCEFETTLVVFEASTTVNILVEPKVYVSAGLSTLIDGGNETVVATCIAEQALPPAAVSWESNLFGRSEVQLFHEVNGTTSTRVSYLWQPTRHVQGPTLTCVVLHPALLSDIRIPHQLHVQFPPIISVVGYDGDWYVGREHVQMTCKANANPPAHHYRWITLDSEMPEGVEIMNNTLLFLRPLQRNNSEVYRCEVANDINLRSSDVHILIQDPPTTPSTITTTVLTDAASSTLVNDTHDPFISPTPEAPPKSNQGSIVGWVVGGSLFLLLLGLFYRRTRFRGTYTVRTVGEINVEMI